MNKITMKPTIIKELIKSIEKEKKQALKDCWNYHKDLFKDSNSDVRKTELEDFLYDMNLENWEDVGFFVGYLRGLDWLRDKIVEE